MNYPQQPGAAQRRTPGRLSSPWAWFVGLAVGLLGPAHLTLAQPAPATAPATASATAPEDASVSPELGSIPGVRPGMTRSELISLAAEAAEGGKLSDAEKILSAVVAEDRENLRALTLLAHVYERQARVAKTSQDADRYIDWLVRTYEYAAALALRTGDTASAEQMYRMILTYRRGSPTAKLGLGRVLRETGQDLAAIEHYRKYLETPILGRDASTDPSRGSPDARHRTYGDVDSLALLELGRIYLSTKRLLHAISTLEAARRIDPENPDILIELALAYQENRKHDKAVDLVKKALANAPRKADYHATYATLLLEHVRTIVDPAEAQATLQQASEATREAVTLGEEAVAGAPDDPELLAALYRYYAAHGAVLGARLQGDMDRIDLPVRIELAEAIQRQAAVSQTLRLHEALDMLLKAEEQGPKEDRIRFLETLAQVQYDVYKRDDAAESCRRLLLLDPDNVVARRIMDSLARKAEGQPSK